MYALLVKQRANSGKLVGKLQNVADPILDGGTGMKCMI